MKKQAGWSGLPLSSGGPQLPLVIPLLFYIGRKSPYPYTLNWLDGFADPSLAKQLYSSHFPLVDVTAIPDEEIMQHRSMAALTLLQKHIRRRDLTELLDRLAILFLAEHTSRQQLSLLVNYMLQAGEVRNAEIFIHELARRIPQQEEVLMTIAQQLKQIGLKEGLERGRKEEALKIAQTMLRNGMDNLTVMRMTGLTESEIAQLCH